MAYKIILDSGHGGSDPGAVYNGRREKDDTLKIALAVGKLLAADGYDVAYTRTTDVYQTPYEKAQIANKAGADLFISIHRNSSAVPNRYAGVESLVYDMSGMKVDLAENIDSQLAALGFRDIGVSARPNLVVLRRTKMPAVLVEVGFLNTESDNRLLDSKFSQVARAIADGIEETVSPTGQEVLYRVQVGAFRSRDNAGGLLGELKSQDFPGFLTYRDGLYRVQVGAFRELDNAVRMEQRLRQKGYPTYLVSE